MVKLNLKTNILAVFGIKLLHFAFCKEASQNICSQAIWHWKRSYNTTAPHNMQSEIYSEDEMNKEAKDMIPPLTFQSHKGQAGRIGIIGGSEEYTGAPYFSAISALKVGADLCHVFCTKEASPVIKSYSPELIVHPLLDSENAVDSIKEWFPRLHAMVIGPGLGRLPFVLKVVKQLIPEIKARNMPIIVDADGLFLITQFPTIIQGYHNAILTPNAVEFNRLAAALNLKSEKSEGDVEQQFIAETIALSQAMHGVSVLRKGFVDIIAHGDKVAVVKEGGSPRRCGGQGDLLSGALGVFAYWAQSRNTGKIDSTLIAGYSASVLTKRCAQQAFSKHGRSTTTTDLISEIHSVFEAVF